MKLRATLGQVVATVVRGTPTRALVVAGAVVMATALVTVQQPRPAHAASYCSSFVTDVNVPDGTPMAPNQGFTKTWRLRNCGSANWSGVQAVRISGSYGPSSFGVPNVGVNQTGDISAGFTAPSAAGTYQAKYQLKGPQGQFGTTFWVTIKVNPPTNDCSAWGNDLSYGDGTAVTAGQSINKGWRLRNCGNTTWSGYTAVRVSGSYGPSSFSVPAVGPNSTGDLWTGNFTVPSGAGRQKATYQLKGPRGQFGITFWVDLDVKAPPSAPTISSLGCTPSVQPKQPVSCSPSISGTVTSRTWTASGGSTSSGSGTTFSTSYTSTGDKTITLRACNQDKCATRSDTVKVSTQPSPSLSVTPFGQTNGPWAKSPLGNTLAGDKWNGYDLNFYNFGCFVTSLSMIFNYRGNHGTDPSQLNALLKANGGFENRVKNAQGGWVSTGAQVVWGGVAQVARGFGLKPAGTSSNWADVDTQLQSGNPVMAIVHLKNFDDHAIVIVGRDATGYKFIDSWNGSTGTWKAGAASANGAAGTFEYLKTFRFFTRQ